MSNGPNKDEVIENPPSSAEVMREVVITILVCLGMAMAAEIFMRAVTLG
jgi:hypothetical protein